MERGGGAIVNISSVSGLRGAAGRAHYAASKFAVIGLSESLAMEVAEAKIRVNCIAPASVRSQMTLTELMKVTGIEDPARADEVWTQVSAKRLPFGRSVEPEDIGRAVVFLCSAEMISGVVLPVTGGEDLRRGG
jgi:3-oxoacyl-[acyl-carrier protein] reductase